MPRYAIEAATALAHHHIHEESTDVAAGAMILRLYAALLRYYERRGVVTMLRHIMAR